MQQDKMENILKDLYELDPSLRQYGDKLNVLLQKLLESEPDAEADDRFVAKLRHELVTHQTKQTFLNSIFNMNKTPFVAVGMVMTLAIVITASIALVNLPAQKKMTKLVSIYAPSAQQTVELAANAFGKLSLGGQNILNKAPMPSANLPTSEVARSAIDAIIPEVGFGGGAPAAPGSVATKMMADVSGMPYYNYQYNLVYAGDDFKITDKQMPVYRLSADENIIKAVAQSVLSADFGFIDLSKFGNASVGSMSLSQGQGGYNIYLNFDQGRISLDKNQPYIAYAEPSIACLGSDCKRGGYPEQTYNQLSDGELIKIANAFIDKYNINKTAYGAPVVENGAIVYPVMFDGKLSYDFGGYLNGMRVTVNSMDMSVQSISEIINPIFEKSNYEIETDFNRILKVAQMGGFNGGFYGAAKEGESLNLGTPKYVYLHQYDYSTNDGRVRELYIPALLFPITDLPKDRYMYQTSVIVPIAKDFLDSYVGNGIGVPTPLPMPYTTGAGSSEPGVVSGSPGSGVVYPDAPINY